MDSSIKAKNLFVTGSSPIPALTCPAMPGLVLRRSRPAQPELRLRLYCGHPALRPYAPTGPLTLRVHVQNRCWRFCRSSTAPSRMSQVIARDSDVTSGSVVHLILASASPSARRMLTSSPGANCATEVTRLSPLLTVAKPRARVFNGLSVSSDLLCNDS